MSAIQARRMAGQCTSGAERDGGKLFHAVARNKALCGAKPGRRSVGWSAHLGEKVTCPRCLKKMENIKLAWRYWSKTVPRFYVAQVPGDDGVDWGYTTDQKKALPLTKGWQARFRADCRRVGVAARFEDVS